MNDFWTALAAVIAALGFFGAGYRAGYLRARRDVNSGHKKDRFDRIYAPLYGLFATCHITIVSAQAAPHLKHRVRNALSLLIYNRRVAAAVKALFDKQDLGISGEVEYGGRFPHVEIARCLRNNEKHADQILLDLIARSNRSQYEEMPEECQLTEADLKLYNHICSEYEKLGEIFAKA